MHRRAKNREAGIQEVNTHCHSSDAHHRIGSLGPIPRIDTDDANLFHGWIRDEIEVRIQSIAEEEVTQFLGRGWYERKGVVDAAPGYRNGYGKPRRLSICCGTIKIKRPRVRGLKERFESRILPLFARHTKEVGALLPELYLHGLAQGDFELALRGLLGDGAPLSSSSIARLRGQWETDYQTWQERRLHDRELVYAWADGIYVKAGLEKDKACLLVVGAGTWLQWGRDLTIAEMRCFRPACKTRAALQWGRDLTIAEIPHQESI